MKRKERGRRKGGADKQVSGAEMTGGGCTERRRRKSAEKTGVERRRK